MRIMKQVSKMYLYQYTFDTGQVKLNVGQSVLTVLVGRPTKVATKYTSMVAIGNAPNVMATKIVTVPNYKENHSNHFNDHLEVNINEI